MADREAARPPRRRRCLWHVSAVLLAVLASFCWVEQNLLRGLARAELCPGKLPASSEQQAACSDDAIRGAIKGVDTHTLWLFNHMKQDAATDDRNSNIPGGEVMFKPVDKQTLTKTTIGVGFTPQGEKYGPWNGKYWDVKVPMDDLEDFPGYYNSTERRIASFALGWLRLDTLHPLRDIDAPWPTAGLGAAALRAAADADLNQRKLSPRDDHVSDAAMSHWAFSGLAAHRLECPGITGYRFDLIDGKVPMQKRDDEYCMVDFRWVGMLPVRTTKTHGPGSHFEKYGAAAFFDKGRKLTKIFWVHGNQTVYPGDADWEHAKWAWKCSVLTGVTVRDHLTNTHLMTANLLTVASREALSSDHPLRRLIKPFTYGTTSINYAATETLVIRNSLVHRATALTWGAFEQGFQLLFTHDRWGAGGTTGSPSTLEYLQLRGTDVLGDQYPFGEDWADFHRVVARFVEDYVDLYYDDDAMVQDDTELDDFWQKLRAMPGSGLPKAVDGKARLKAILGAFFEIVTGVHNQVGNVADYLIDPSFVSGKIRPGVEVADVQASFQAFNIALSTAVKKPMLLAATDHLLLDGRAKRVWTAFRTALVDLSETIESRNRVRGAYACNAMNPKKMLFSVSV